MRTLPFLIASVMILCPSLAVGEDQAYFGLLHAHTYFSDGSGTPNEAYTRAEEKGVDFFAVTPHNHKKAEMGAKDRTDGILVGKKHALYEGSGTVKIKRNGTTVRPKSVIRAAKDATTPDFLPLYGQEFSTISGGNHVNVFGLPDVLTIASGNFKPFYEKLDQRAITSGSTLVVQMNHPNVQSDLFYSGSSAKQIAKMKNDYGYDEYGMNFGELVPAADPHIVLIELLSGPAMKKHRTPNHHYHVHVNDYYFYLVQGFHISPSVGHDNHYKTWGDTTDAMMGVWAASLSEPDVISAMKANKTWATEDKDLQINFTANGQSMGSNQDLAAGSDIVFSVTASDPSDDNDTYEIEVYYGDVDAANEDSLVNWKASDGKQVDTFEIGDSGSVDITGFTASGVPEFFYVKVTQSDGDRAWSGPVWFNHPRPEIAAITTENIQEFVWTKGSSKVYHQLGCRTAARIKDSNLRRGLTPPAGRHLHSCVIVSEGEGH